MLTEKQELFVRKIIEGETQADAYRAAYSTAKMSDKTVWEKASRLMADDKVRARVQELRDQIASESIMTAQERQQFLSRIIKGIEKEKQTVFDSEGVAHEVEVPYDIKYRLQSLDYLNKMTGEYTTKVEGSLGVKLEDLL